MKDFTTRPTQGNTARARVPVGGKDENQLKFPWASGRSPRPGIEFGGPGAVTTSDPYTEILFAKLAGQKETDPISRPFDLGPSNVGTA